MTTEPQRENEIDVANLQAQQAGTQPVQEPEPKLVITLEGRDVEVALESLNLTMDSTERAILTAARGIAGENIVDGEGEFSFTVRKALNSNKIYVYPKPVAG